MLKRSSKYLKNLRTVVLSSQLFQEVESALKPESFNSNSS